VKARCKALGWFFVAHGGRLSLEAARSSVTLPQPLRSFWRLNVVLSVACGLIMLGAKFLLHAQYPYTWPFIPFYGWIDFVCFKQQFHYFHHLNFFDYVGQYDLHFMYPAPVALLYEGFYALHWHSLSIFLLSTGGLVLLLAALLGREMVQRGIAPRIATLFIGSALCFSYPFWFEYLLGNVEVCIFLIVAFGIVAFLRGQLVLSATLIGIAASMKIFPFVYLALFLSRRKYREFGLGIAVAAVMNVFSLWMVCPSLPVAYRGIEAGLAMFRTKYMLRYLPVETGFDHSIFGLIKRFGHHFLGPVMPSSLLTGYMVAVAVAGIALYFLRIRYLPLLNQILSLFIASILLPPTSHDYTLIHLYVPWGLMVLYAIDLARAGRSVEGLRGAFVCFAILMSAESELVYKAGYSGQLKAVTLVVLLVIALRRPWTAVDGVGWAADALEGGVDGGPMPRVGEQAG
jgi:hypothetical protein